jgi:hypothetical protein
MSGGQAGGGWTGGGQPPVGGQARVPRSNSCEARASVSGSLSLSEPLWSGSWGGSPCTAVTPACTDKEAGSDGVGFSMETRVTWAEGDERTEDTQQRRTTSSDQLAHQAPAQRHSERETVREAQ